MASQSPQELPAARTPRRRERRQALATVLAASLRHLDRNGDAGMMRGAFETAVRAALPVRTVRLRDGERWAPAGEAVHGPDTITLDVRGPDQTPQAVLETTVNPTCPLGDWDVQMLGVCAQIGALVLEVDRCRTQLARAGVSSPGRPARDGAAPLIGSAPGMRALRSTIERIATTDFTVLLEGESGVGKELVARQIHDLSRRRNGPFVAINCAALVESLLEAELFGIEDRTATGVRGRRGKFEAADGGTLFLDEVSDLSLSAQAKLLRAIQDLAVERVGANGAHKVDTRIIAATNRGLAELVERKLFRLDLFYRLSGVDIRVPPLRERRGDVRELAAYFLERHRMAHSLKLSQSAADALTAYDWPGNVRELERLIERAIALCDGDQIEVDDLPAAIRADYAVVLRPSLERNETMRVWGSRYAQLVVSRHGGNKRQACRALGISYHTLQAYLRQTDDGAVCRESVWGETVAPIGAEGDSLTT